MRPAGVLVGFESRRVSEIIRTHLSYERANPPGVTLRPSAAVHTRIVGGSQRRELRWSSDLHHGQERGDCGPQTGS